MLLRHPHMTMVSSSVIARTGLDVVGFDLGREWPEQGVADEQPLHVLDGEFRKYHGEILTLPL